MIAQDLENINVTSFASMPTPEALHAKLPLTDAASATVTKGREDLRNILDRKDKRLFVVVGPCSIHDPVAGLDYARRLKALQEEVKDTMPYTKLKRPIRKPSGMPTSAASPKPSATRRSEARIFQPMPWSFGPLR